MNFTLDESVEKIITSSRTTEHPFTLQINQSPSPHITVSVLTHRFTLHQKVEAVVKVSFFRSSTLKPGIKQKAIVAFRDAVM